MDLVKTCINIEGFTNVHMCSSLCNHHDVEMAN
jgi:hypothetical protein